MRPDGPAGSARQGNRQPRGRTLLELCENFEGLQHEQQAPGSSCSWTLPRRVSSRNPLERRPGRGRLVSRSRLMAPASVGRPLAAGWLARRNWWRSAIQANGRRLPLRQTRPPFIASGWSPTHRQRLVRNAIRHLHRRWRLPAPELLAERSWAGRRWLRAGQAPRYWACSGPASGGSGNFSPGGRRPLHPRLPVRHSQLVPKAEAYCPLGPVPGCPARPSGRPLPVPKSSRQGA